jgi:hypothetical protein
MWHYLNVPLCGTTLKSWQNLLSFVTNIHSLPLWTTINWRICNSGVGLLTFGAVELTSIWYILELCDINTDWSITEILAPQHHNISTMSCKVLINTGYHFLYDKPFLVFIINFPESIPYTLLLLYSLLSDVTPNRQTSGESASLSQSAEVATSDVTPRSGWVKLAKMLW